MWFVLSRFELGAAGACRLSDWKWQIFDPATRVNYKPTTSIARCPGGGGNHINYVNSQRFRLHFRNAVFLMTAFQSQAIRDGEGVRAIVIIASALSPCRFAFVLWEYRDLT